MIYPAVVAYKRNAVDRKATVAVQLHIGCFGRAVGVFCDVLHVDRKFAFCGFKVCKALYRKRARAARHGEYAINAVQITVCARFGFEPRFFNLFAIGRVGIIERDGRRTDYRNIQRATYNAVFAVRQGYGDGLVYASRLRAYNKRNRMSR